MTEHFKAPEKIQLSEEEIANLSDAEFKTLVIRMLTDMVECSWKMEEKVKAMRSEIKRDVQGTNSEGKETSTQTNDLEQRAEINIQPEQNEETKFRKMKRGLGTSGTTLNVPTSESQGCQKGKRNSKKLKTYLNK